MVCWTAPHFEVVRGATISIQINTFQSTSPFLSTFQLTLSNAQANLMLNVEFVSSARCIHWPLLLYNFYFHSVTFLFVLFNVLDVIQEVTGMTFKRNETEQVLGT